MVPLWDLISKRAALFRSLLNKAKKQSFFGASESL